MCGSWVGGIKRVKSFEGEKMMENLQLKKLKFSVLNFDKNKNFYPGLSGAGISKLSPKLNIN